jgi:hypothetical protein
VSFLSGIKKAMGRQSLKGLVSVMRRNREVKSLNDSTTVGILFDPTENDDYVLVKKYVDYLKDMKKKVKALGFYDLKDIPASTYSKLEFDYFSQKDLNWQLKPSGVIVENFIKEEYDILIDLNTKEHFPLFYISSLSHARYKVGATDAKDTSIYDMLIGTGTEKGVKPLLRNIDTYLLMLNKKV